MNSIISSFGIVLHALILAEGKYLLMEIEKPEVLGHDVSSETVSRQSPHGECLKVPFLGILPGANGATNQHPDRFWSCSQSAFLKPERATEEEFKQGNYVQFNVQMTQNTQLPFLNIIGINERYCIPPEKECNCDELMDRLLTSKASHGLEDPARKDLPTHMAMAEIRFDFNKETCQCLLRTAEKVGFQYARIIEPLALGPFCTQIKVVDSSESESSPMSLCEKPGRHPSYPPGFFQRCRAERIALSKQ